MSAGTFGSSTTTIAKYVLPGTGSGRCRGVRLVAMMRRSWAAPASGSPSYEAGPEAGHALPHGWKGPRGGAGAWSPYRGRRLRPFGLRSLPRKSWPTSGAAGGATPDPEAIADASRTRSAIAPGLRPSPRYQPDCVFHQRAIGRLRFVTN